MTTTSIRPHTHNQQPQFAGKKNLKQAGFIALMLGSAGGAAALQNNSHGLGLNHPAHSKNLTDTFNYNALSKPLSPQKLAQMEALIHSNEDMALTEGKPSRKLLQAATNPLDEFPPLYLQDDAEDVQAREFLKKPPFVPKNTDLLGHFSYPESRPYYSAPVKAMSEAELKAGLEKSLTQRFDGNTSKAKKAAQLFDDPVLKTKVPNPQLRAAIVNLVKTAGKGAIDVYKGDVFEEVKHDDFSGKPYENGHGVSILLPGNTKRSILIDANFKGEDFRVLSPLMVHEAVHQDNTSTDTEELIADTLQSLVHGQLLAEEPSLAKAGTEISRLNNARLFSYINSRDSKGNMRIFNDQSKIVMPNSNKPNTNFGSFRNIETLEDAQITPGSEYLKSALKAITGKDVPDPYLDGETLDLLDKNQHSLKPATILKIAKALDLDVGEVASIPAAAPADQPTPAPKKPVPSAVPKTPTNKPTQAQSASETPAPTNSQSAESSPAPLEEALPPVVSSAASSISLPKKVLLALGIGAGALGMA
ncbi:hypothetical protein [Vampirovibrio sp.]|uniref:hypothetical protein n=1 Tax=Vampirovibrio sp. TaxID=2717857 RepID=UPI003593D70B